MKKLTAILLALSLLLGLCACGASPAEPEEGWKVEENTRADDKAIYPLMVRTESATWYLAADDIALLGEEAMLEGLFDLLQYQEEDFADARAVLAPCLSGEVPPVDIYTDFCGNAGISELGGAYYNQQRNMIKVFSGWEVTKYTLLHEYVHYLTIRCAQTPVRHGLFSEGIAEYVSKLVCRDRMLRSYFSALDDEQKSFFRSKGAWNEEEDCLDPLRYYYGLAELYAKGGFDGEEFFSTSDVLTVRTPEMRLNPAPGAISHYEAACFLAYLAENYSEQTLLAHLDLDPEQMEQVYGESFPVLYARWAEWNSARCAELGLIT